jgi:hypothetical protein
MEPQFGSTLLRTRGVAHQTFGTDAVPLHLLTRKVYDRYVTLNPPASEHLDVMKIFCGYRPLKSLPNMKTNDACFRTCRVAA